ncbi:3-oxoacyl-ACP reductase FabG [Methyloligella solikamskensis]|uniref:3-oxoacyl-ACP reductase FabG n=1 Tax=Methyloligella solikamskensis TaxID=1177756 RepID=A0ABW3JC52_9HYPH
MFKSLEGRTAIVTGGSKGIGRGIAKRFGEAGINVLVVSRHLEEAEKVAKEIGDHASGFQADVSDPDACEAMAKAAADRYGGIDILCANAGIFPSAKLGEMTPQDFDFVMDTNLKSTFLCVSAVLPYLKQKKSGRIVITSSITGPITGFPGWSHYGASKAGQLGFMKTAAIELAPNKITVNAVLPGNIMTEGLADTGEEYLEGMKAAIPLHELGDVADIANAALYFASDEASYVTGQTIVVDGGQVLPESPEALDEMDS